MALDKYASKYCMVRVAEGDEPDKVEVEFTTGVDEQHLLPFYLKRDKKAILRHWKFFQEKHIMKVELGDCDMTLELEFLDILFDSKLFLKIEMIFYKRDYLLFDYFVNKIRTQTNIEHFGFNFIERRQIADNETDVPVNEAVEALLSNTTMTSLRMHTAVIVPDFARIVLDTVSICPNIRKLSITGRLAESDLDDISAVLETNSLPAKTLCVATYGNYDGGANNRFLHALAVNKSLRTIIFSGLNLKPKTHAALARVFSTNTSLEVLWSDSSVIVDLASYEDTSNLLEAITNNTTIKALKIVFKRDTGSGYPPLFALLDAVAKNTSVKYFEFSTSYSMRFYDFDTNHTILRLTQCCERMASHITDRNNHNRALRKAPLSSFFFT